MEDVIKLIHEFFAKNNMKYKYNEKKKLFTSGVKMNSVLGNLRLNIFIRENSYVVYAILNSTPEIKFYGEVAEYLHRANYGLLNGNFEFDYRDGEIRYKVFVDFEGIQLSMDAITESIVVPAIMFDQYGKNLLRIMMGDGIPEELIKKAEEDIEIEECSPEVSIDET